MTRATTQPKAGGATHVDVLVVGTGISHVGLIICFQPLSSSMMAGFVEQMGLAPGADPSRVSAETLWRLGAHYVPIILTLWLTILLIMGS